MATTQLTPLQRAFLALEETRAKLDRFQRKEREPIAIVGIGCRTPGDGDTPDNLWRVFRDGVDGIGPVPPNRWDADAVYDSNVDTPGKTITRQAGFIKNVDMFDPGVFGISPREAQGIDPQQRLFLEVAWEAFENGGIAPDSLLNSQTGVFLGICTNDFLHLQLETKDLGLLDAHFSTGIAHSVASGRLSYILGLQGPCISIDTACSSGLVAVHYACQSLRTGECRMAVASGINLMLSPDLSIAYSHSRMLAPDGHCKTFDAAADGFARGEGCGVVILKRLSDALADGDRIIAQIRGTAINQDGPSSGLTAPNGPAQEAVIRQALQSAGLTPNDVGYIEAHGTGTQLGDPLEMRALGAVFGPGRPAGSPLYVGSSKSNFGHLEGAAGIVGLLKVVLSLQQGTIAPNLHFKNPSPHIPWDELPFIVPTEAIPWPDMGGTRIGGVSSFGFSGTNAHIVIEQAPSFVEKQPTIRRPLHLIALSAQTESALSAAAGRIAASLNDREDNELGDVAFTLNTGRALFPVRASFAARTINEAQEKLTSIAKKKLEPGVSTGRVPVNARPRVAFLFTGQGSQYAGMAQTLYETCPQFRETVEKCAAELDTLLPKPLLSVLFPAAGTLSPIDETGFAQPSLFVIEYALAMLWKSWGVEPIAVLGHSVGEVVAACVAGVLSLPDALKLVAIRGRLMQSCPPGGGMRAVFASRDQIEKFLTVQESVEIAAINGPNHIVLSGQKTALDAIGKMFETAGIKSKALVVSHAFHSALMDPILAEFESELRAITFGTPQIRLISNLTGQVADASHISSPRYWRDHIRNPVLFHQGMNALAALKCDAIVEIGPAPVLTAVGQECLSGDLTSWCASLRRGRDDWEQMFDSLSKLHMLGVPIDMTGLDAGYSRRRLSLPTYQFQRERYWFKARPPQDAVLEGDATGSHPLLGSQILSPLPQTQFQSRLSALRPSFINDHQVNGTTLLPGTASVEMAQAAAQAIFGPGFHSVEDLVLREAMIFEGETRRVVQTVVEAVEDGAARFRIESTIEGSNVDWMLHFEGRLRGGAKVTASDQYENLSAIAGRCSGPVSAESLYTAVKEQGFDFGEQFHVLRSIKKGRGEALGEVALRPENISEAEVYSIHPILLDGCVQTIAAALPQAERGTDRQALYLPVGIRRIRIFAKPGAGCSSHAVVEEGARQGINAFRASVRLYDASGNPLAELEGIELQRVDGDAIQRIAARRSAQTMHVRIWEPAQIGSETEAGRETGYVILSDRAGIGAGLAKLLQEQGCRCLLWPPEKTSGQDYKTSDMKILCRQWRQEFGTSFGVVDLRWLDTPDWRSSDGQPSEKFVSESVVGSLTLLQAMVAELADAPPRLWTITRGGQPVGEAKSPLSPWQSAAWGMSWSAALEYPEFRHVRLDLDPAVDADEIASIAAELGQDGQEDQVALRGDQRFVARLVKYADTKKKTGSVKQSYRLVPQQKGSIDAFTTLADTRKTPGPGEVEIKVEATGLNFRDVLNALNLYPGDPGPLGGECAGTIVRVGPGVNAFAEGDRVMAMAPGCFASHVIARGELTHRIPAGYTAVEAATLPIAYLTATYTLDHLAKLKSGEKVLIHAGAGGVGMAAIQVALRSGAEIFATAGTPLKRSRLRALGVHHLFDSRRTDFADEILTLTNGRGVDVVLNSLSGPFIEASFKATATGGRFVEIGKRGIWTRDEVKQLDRNIEYHIVDVGTTSDEDPALIAKLFSGFCDELSAGKLRDFPVTAFSWGDASIAFRHMMQARQIGKIVVTHELAPVAPVTPSTPVRTDGTYLITGGLSGLGLKVAEWLAERGAKHLALVGRRGVTDEAKATVAAMRSQGVMVETAKLDVADASAVESFLEALRSKHPPLRGVLHAAGIIDDGSILTQDWNRFAAVLHPKALGAQILDHLTRKDPLDWFVMFSSAASVVGSPGQANYAAANTVLDVLAHERRRLGRPAQSINWGSWQDIGLSAGDRMQERVRSSGLNPMTPRQGLSQLEAAMASDSIQLGVLNADWRKLVARRSSDVIPMYFSALAGKISRKSNGAAAHKTQNLRDLVEAAPPSRRRSVLRNYIRDCAIEVLGQKDKGLLDDQTPLRDFGLDSLLAVELRNALSRSLNTSLPATLLFDYSTVGALTNFLWTEVLDGSTESDRSDAALAEVQTGSTVLMSVTEMSDEDVERLLAAKQ